MEPSRHTPIEEMEVFRRFVAVADWVWNRVGSWAPLAQQTVGAQLIRASDSIGANLVEGDGRGSDRDSRRFFIISRASARETRYWLTRAAARGLITAEEAEQKIAEVIGATQLLNRLIRYRRNTLQGDRVCEIIETYSTDPLCEPA